jgi:hypothetical protein
MNVKNQKLCEGEIGYPLPATNSLYKLRVPCQVGKIPTSPLRAVLISVRTAL